jgi:A/G-specific adenine glycosylase
VILQQTRIEQGLAYYNRFAEKYPDVRSLANAKEDDVLKLWQGLGYYSRARNLHAAAKQVVNDFSAKFPSEYSDILSLKGIGEYTAAAIASFAFGKEHAVVDGNVFRLLSRYFGIKTPIDSTTGKKEFVSVANDLIKGHRPEIYNQAIMEFGAMQCRPVNPLCETCPLVASCFAFKNKLIDALPVKSKSIKIRKRYFNYIVIKKNDSFYIKQRKQKDIWQGLHDFPLIESENKIEESELISSDELRAFNLKKLSITKVSREYKHVLSHQHIHAKFYEVAGDLILNDANSDWKKVSVKSVKKYAVPRLIEMYLEDRGPGLS